MRRTLMAMMLMSAVVADTGAATAEDKKERLLLSAAVFWVSCRNHLLDGKTADRNRSRHLTCMVLPKGRD